GCCCSPDNLRPLSIQKSLTHHRLQCPDNGLCFPVSYDPTEVESPEDSWFSVSTWQYSQAMRKASVTASDPAEDGS
ncbi:TPA: hypothetical protein ACF94D_004421, partial [Klebsiella michiganensis]